MKAMAKELNLSTPKKAAEHVVLTTTAVAGAIIDMCVPLAGTTLAQACGHLVRKRMEKASEILIEELKKGNIEILNDEKYEAFVPMAYRFFEAARQGASVKKLKFLAQCLDGAIKPDKKHTDDFIRLSAKLEKLDDSDLQFISIVQNFILKLETDSKFNNNTDQKNYFVCSKNIISLYKIDLNFDAVSMKLSRLQSAGLLYPAGGSFWDQESEYYYPDDDFDLLCQLALSEGKEE